VVLNNKKYAQNPVGYQKSPDLLAVYQVILEKQRTEINPDWYC
jgi:hypothetical protein